LSRLTTKNAQQEFRDTDIAMFRLDNLSRPPIFLLQTLDFIDKPTFCGFSPNRE